MASSDTPQLSGLKFQVQKILNTDEHGTVVLIGDQSNFGKPYALKKIKRDDEKDDVWVERARATFEASQEQKLTSNAFLQYYDLQIKKKWFKVVEANLLMEYVNGSTLAKLGKPAMGQSILIFQQLASALALLHRRKVYHGDLRPANVLVSRSGQVKVMNFGLAPVQAKFPKLDMGGRDVMAPEQIREHVINEKTDLYSFGAIMYQVLTGRPANTGSRIMGEGGKIPLPQSLNPAITTALNNLIVSCLQTDPDKRPDGMFDVNQKLEKLIQDQGLEAEQLKGLGGDTAST
jgi:serine/threonine-protein kinase